MDDTLVSIITVLAQAGDTALPLVSSILLIICLFYYRRDQTAWRDQNREDLITSIKAIERNTAVLEKVAEITRLRLEDRN